MFEFRILNFPIYILVKLQKVQGKNLFSKEEIEEYLHKLLIIRNLKIYMKNRKLFNNVPTSIKEI